MIKKQQEIKELKNKLIEKQKDIRRLKSEIIALKKEISLLSEINQVVTQTFDLNEITRSILEKISKAMKVERASLMLLDEKSSTLKIYAAVGIKEEVIKSAKVKIGNRISGWVAHEGKPLLIENIDKDSRFRHKKIGSQNFKTPSLLTVPLFYKNKTIGVLNVNNKINNQSFTKKDEKLLKALASQAATAIQNAKLFQELTSKETEKLKMRNILGLYVSPTVASYLLKEGQLENIRKIERKEVTVMFSDIRGFTPLLEEMSPEEVVNFLNKFFTIATNIIFKYEGTIDKFIGDAVMAIFGTPVYHSKDKGMGDPERAVMAALEMRDKFDKIVSFLQLHCGEFYDVGLGIGINTGYSVVGNIGSDKRVDYTVIGSEVNLASRLCSIAGPGEILISENTYKYVSPEFVFKKKPSIKIKGKTRPHQVFEVLDRQE